MTLVPITTDYGGNLSTSLLNRVATEDIQDGAVTPAKLFAGGTETTYIWVSAADGNDTTGTGSVTAPYATITKAFSTVTAARNTIYVLPGTYTEASILTWPNVNNVQLIGLDWGGNVTITAPADASAEVILINPTFTSATLSAFIENVLIYHGNSTIGVKIDNAHMGSRKLMVYLLTVPTYGSGNSVDMSHTVTGQAIRIYMVNCDEVTVLVNLLTTTTDDRFRFRNCTLIGGVTNTGAIASEITFIDSVLLTSGLTTNGANLLTLVGSIYRTSTTGVYTPAITGAQLSASSAIASTQLASGVTKVLTGTIGHADTTKNVLAIPANALVTDVIAVCTETWNGASASLELGVSGTLAGFIPIASMGLTATNVTGTTISTRGTLLWQPLVLTFATSGTVDTITNQGSALQYYTGASPVNLVGTVGGSAGATGSTTVYCVYVALA